MNRRMAFALSVAILLTIGVLVWRFVLLSPRTAALTSTLPPLSKDSVSPAAPLSATPEPRRDTTVLADRKRAAITAIESANVPIAFWGKVVDQDSNPLPGVLVKFTYSVEHAAETGIPWSDTRVFKSTVLSDSEGMFSIADIKGSYLHIESLEKQGFQHKARRAMVFNYFGHTARERFSPDKNRPVQFMMVNKATVEQLMSYGGSFGKTFRVPANGAPVHWNLWSGQIDPNGELQVTFNREPAVVATVGQPVTWSANLRIIGGGIVETLSEELFYRAPEEGYVAALDYPKLEQKRGVSARSFYIKTADGKYGRVELDLYADDEGSTARCLIKAVMNPSGSRNLEF